MNLKQLTGALGALHIQGGTDREITALCSDSRKVVPGAMFVAVKGFDTDGHRYIDAALAKGAAAILYEEGAWTPGADAGGAAFIAVENSRRALALAAEHLDPAEQDSLLPGLVALGSPALAKRLLAAGAERKDAPSAAAYDPARSARLLALQERS